MLIYQFLVSQWTRGNSLHGYRHSDCNVLMKINLFLFSNSRASDFGLMKIDEEGRIRQFLEKPKGESLRSMVAALPILCSIYTEIF